ncbi:hypothetical protein FJTKL_09234 [Diaporthe vaccinii]|uniref:Mitochondrial 40S ribosomal protein MRP2 n=1 Tax=Diaporthe vaccinii TaxID=105482 RepID=A0ABR4ENK5_9PEZI
MYYVIQHPGHRIATFLPIANIRPVVPPAKALPKMSMFRAKKLDLGCFVNIKVIRDHTKRKVYEKHEAERQALRYIIRNTTLAPRVRAEAQLQLTQMHCYTNPTQIRNRCILSGKGRGVFSDFKMSRYNFRLQAIAGSLPGVQKASW